MLISSLARAQAGQEKEMLALKNKHLVSSKQVSRLETDVVRYKSEAEELANRAEGRAKINSDRLEELKQAQAENRSLKTEIEETKHKLKQSQSMLKSTQGKGVSVGEAALQKERDMLFVSLGSRKRHHARSLTWARHSRASCDARPVICVSRPRSSRLVYIVSRGTSFYTI